MGQYWGWRSEAILHAPYSWGNRRRRTGSLIEVGPSYERGTNRHFWGISLAVGAWRRNKSGRKEKKIADL